MVEVKSNKHLDPPLIKFNESVISKFFESFSQVGIGDLGINVVCVYWRLIT